MVNEIPNNGSMDEVDITERQVRLASHGSMMMGEFVMKDRAGEIVAVSPITMDHQMIGSALNSEAGSGKAEEILYKDLDAEQQRIYDELVAAGVLPGCKEQIIWKSAE